MFIKKGEIYTTPDGTEKVRAMVVFVDLDRIKMVRYAKLEWPGGVFEMEAEKFEAKFMRVKDYELSGSRPVPEEVRTPRKTEEKYRTQKHNPYSGRQ